jgi:hypothetical protein
LTGSRTQTFMLHGHSREVEYVKLFTLDGHGDDLITVTEPHGDGTGWFRNPGHDFGPGS